MHVLLLSTYDLGRQPFGVASPAAWLHEAGIAVVTRDLSREPLIADEVRAARLVAFYLPMHTATRLALPAIARVRSLNPSATIAAFGLYALLAETLLREQGVEHVLGPEAEADLVVLARDDVVSRGGVGAAAHVLPRLAFKTPRRAGLPPLHRYASLQMPDGTHRVTGATEASRGCKHRCRHCPIVPVYDGQFRVVPLDVVLEDIDQQVAAGAQHITFGDPDFFNGPRHARRIVEALHARHPALSYDVTIKVEHLLTHAELLPVLAQTGCAFITSAVEAIDDEVLRALEKGHTRQDFFAAVEACNAAGVPLSPTFVAFTPWTTIDSYRQLLSTLAELQLVEHVAPIQWTLRLLITHGSRLLELPDIGGCIGPFDPGSLTYPWRHADRRVDELQRQVMHAVGARAGAPRAEVFRAICHIAGASHGPMLPRAAVPYLDEPWYC
jgi:radical SAM superfamily enzyme YgiQ (UPF0313 family)